MSETRTIRFTRKQAHASRKGRRLPIRNIVLHSSDGRKDGDLATLTGDDVSAHWYVTRAAEVFYLVNDEDTAFHAGKVFNPDFFSNDATIGIEQEHFDPDGKKKNEDWPDAQIDGSGGETPGDTFLPDTALHFADGKPLNAHHFPFAVIPMVRQIDQSISFERAPLKITLGDIGIAFWQKRRAAFVYGDRGPKWKKIGEGSINFADNLGINSDPNEGGIGANEVPPGVIHIVFPGTSDVANPKDPRTLRTPIEISRIAEEMFLKLTHAL
jgi:hypothetical protein